MNKHYFAFFITLIFVGCTNNNADGITPSNDTECVIIGNIRNLSKCKVELQNEFDGYAVIARSKAKDGKFIIKADASVPTHVFLYSNREEQLREFYVEPGIVHVDGDVEDTFIGATGTITNDYEQKYISELSSLSGEACDSLFLVYAHNSPNDLFILQHIDHARGWTSAEKIDIIKGMDTEVQAMSGVTDLLALLEQRSKVDCQKPYVDITQPNANGIDVSLREIVEKKGNRYVLLDFWATWCAPCREEMPLVKSMYEQYHNQGFDIYACSLDNRDMMKRWKEYINENGLEWTNVCDGEYTSSQAYKDYALQGIPDNVLIECSTGLIIGRSLRGEALLNKLSVLFK